MYINVKDLNIQAPIRITRFNFYTNPTVYFTSFNKNTTGSTIQESIPNNSGLIMIMDQSGYYNRYRVYTFFNRRGSAVTQGIFTNCYYYVFSLGSSSSTENYVTFRSEDAKDVITFSDIASDTNSNETYLSKNYFELVGLPEE